MSEVKWIKITTNMFEDEKIDFIESLPECDAILVIWIKLLSQAGKNNMNGFIFLTENIPYTDEMLSHKFRRPLNTVKLALQTLKQLEMITFNEEGYLKINNWEKHQNIEGLDKIREQTRLRVERHRDKQKALQGIITCQYCGDKATGVDHIIPTSKGGDNTKSNTIPSCIRCNKTKMTQDVATFLNNNQDFINNEIVQNNTTLKNFIKYDSKCNGYVTLRNATELDLDLDLELELEEEVIPTINKMKTFYTPIIEYLNSKSGKNYRATGTKTQDLINARINEGFVLEDFYKVIDIKVAEWKGNDMDKFLRPETLFSNKFEGYLNQDIKAKNNKHDTKFHVETNRTSSYTNNELESVADRKRKEARERMGLGG